MKHVMQLSHGEVIDAVTRWVREKYPEATKGKIITVKQAVTIEVHVNDQPMYSGGDR